MVDEAKAAEIAAATKVLKDSGIKIPESKQEHDDWVPNATEERALSGGWNPDKEAMADPDAWVTAKEFNFRGELMQRITKQGRTIGTIEQQLQQAREMIAASDRVTQKLIKDAVDTTRRDLRAQRRTALEDDDHVRADQIEEELDELKSAQADIKVQQAQPVADTGQRQPTPVEAAWFTFVTSTPWAQGELNGPLLAHAESIRNANPSINVGDFMESVLDKGKELRGLKKRVAPNPGGNDDNKGGQRPQKSRGGKAVWTAADLNEQQRFIGQGYVDDTTIESLDAYAKELGEIGALGGSR
jgi:hypothetical protein